MINTKKICFVLTLFSLFLMTGCKKEDVQITFLYTSDAHGNIVSDENVIGLDVVAAYKKQTKNSILVDSGDFLHGTPLVEQTQGKEVINIMKEVGYSATTIGDADLQYGLNVLKDRADEAKTGKYSLSLLSANLRTKEGSEILDSYSIIKVDGVKVGIFGLTTNTMEGLVSNDIMDELHLLNPIEEAERMVQTLKNKNCDLIVALSHIGNDRTQDVNSILIATQVEGIDFIFDGHRHKTIQANVNNTTIVSPGANGSFIGELSITYSRSKKEILSTHEDLISKEMSLEIEPDEDVARSIQNLTANTP